VIVQTGRRLNDEIKHRLRPPVRGQPDAARILQKSFDARNCSKRCNGFAVSLAIWTVNCSTRELGKMPRMDGLELLERMRAGAL
jgi:hypothetical protein